MMSYAVAVVAVTTPVPKILVTLLSDLSSEALGTGDWRKTASKSAWTCSHAAAGDTAAVAPYDKKKTVWALDPVVSPARHKRGSATFENTKATP